MKRYIILVTFTFVGLIILQCGEGVIPFGQITTEALDGFYVGGSFSTHGSTSSNGIIRLKIDGTIDTDFNAGTGFDAQVNTLIPTVGSSGDIYAGGEFTQYNGAVANYLARLSSAGDQVSLFVPPPIMFDDAVNTLVPLANGQLYAGGDFTDAAGTTRERIARLLATHYADSNFDGGSHFDGGTETVKAILVESDNDVVIGGSFLVSVASTDYHALVRLDTDGSFDATFDTETAFPNPTDVVNTIALAPDSSGDLYVGGMFLASDDTVDYRHIVRVDSNGYVDYDFNTDVGNGFDATVTNEVNTISVATDNSEDIYVGGNFTTFDGVPTNYIVRLNSDGTLDTAFDTGGAGSGFDDVVNIIVHVNDGSGDILVGGAFTTYKGDSANRLVRLNNDGSMDTSFDTGGASGGFQDGAVLAISP